MKKTIYIALLISTQVLADEAMILQDDNAQTKQAIVNAGEKLDADYSKFGVFDEHVAKDYTQLSRSYYKVGKLDNAISYALHALKVEMYLRKDNDPALAKLYYDTGNLYYMHKQHPTALLYMQKATEIYRNSGEKYSKELGDTYEAISSIYINLENFKKSKENLQTCLSIRQKILPPNRQSIKRTEENLKFVKEEISKRKAL